MHYSERHLDHWSVCLVIDIIDNLIYIIESPWLVLLKINLVSFDSMGVRGMATVVETSEGLLFIDPGSALAPRRYGLPPHQEEINELNRKLDTIYKYMEETSIVIITHYHRDHYLYRKGEEQFYRGKLVLAKNPSTAINYSQRVRGYVLFKKMGVENLAKEVVYADGMEMSLGNIRLYFSNPLPHGECNTRLGWVLSVLIDDGDKKLLFASDTQGLLCKESLAFVRSFNWDYLVISGPPTYLSSELDFAKLFGNLLLALRDLDERKYVILDHHLLRDRNYNVFYERIRRETRARVLTAAEYMNQPIRLLEARRDELYGLKKAR